MSERPEEGGLTALEAELRELRPKPDSIDRAVLMYRAGRASARGWIRVLVTAMAMPYAVGLGAFLAMRPARPIGEHIIYVQEPAAKPESPVAKPTESSSPPTSEPLTMEPFDTSPRRRYLEMQEAVLRWGLKGIPPPPLSQPLSEPPTVEQLLQSL